MQHDQRIGVRLLLTTLNSNDMRCIEHAANERQDIADIQPASLAVQRKKPDAQQHHARRQQRAFLQLLPKEQAAAERNQQHINRRQKCILACRRILKPYRLNQIGAAQQKPDQRTADDVRLFDFLQVLSEKHRRNRRANHIAHGDDGTGSKAVQRIFDHSKRTAPNQRSQQKQTVCQNFFLGHVLRIPFVQNLPETQLTLILSQPNSKEKLYTSMRLVYHER